MMVFDITLDENDTVRAYPRRSETPFIVSGFGSHVLVFPLTAGLDLTVTTLSNLIVVRSLVEFTFFESSLLDERSRFG